MVNWGGLFKFKFYNQVCFHGLCQLTSDAGEGRGQDAGGDLASEQGGAGRARADSPRRDARVVVPSRGSADSAVDGGGSAASGAKRGSAAGTDATANSAKTALEQGTTRQRCRPFHQRGFPNVLVRGTVGVAAVCGFHRPDRCGAQETRGFSCSQALRRSSQAHQDEVKEADDIS